MVDGILLFGCCSVKDGLPRFQCGSCFSVCTIGLVVERSCVLFPLSKTLKSDLRT